MENEKREQAVVYANLPEPLVENAIERLTTEQVLRRIWKRDHTVWNDNPDEIANRFGWLESHTRMKESLHSIYDFVSQVRNDGFNRALLLGMGGSSMAPEVYRKIFGLKEGYLDLDILDTTDPDAVLEKENWADPRKTLFIVATKSGGTVETISLMKYFYNKTREAVGRDRAGEHFVAITDPGSGLENTAIEFGFRNIFLNDPEIGGRYSALSYFGLLPAGLIGLDLERLLSKAELIADRMKSGNTVDENSPAWLGATLGLLGESGRDKVTLIISPAIRPFGTWLEQLIAESTGKDNKGLLPVEGETLAAPKDYANDRVFVYLRLEGDSVNDYQVDHLIKAGQPLIQINIQDRYELGGEIFRWMMATAVAGWVMGINPFDQPNVESAKTVARSMTAEYQDKGELPLLNRDLNIEGIEAFSGFKKKDLQATWQEFLRQAKPGENDGRGRSYVSIQAYLKPDPATDNLLQELRSKLQRSYRMAVTVGYGPRFLHSTGQLHKGDAGNGLFIQLTSKIGEDIAIPDEPGGTSSSISFGVLKNAQALGDRQALLDAGRKVIRFHFKINSNKAIEKLIKSLV